MTPFDVEATIKRIIALHRERGEERVSADIVGYAQSLARRYRIGVEKALDVIEADLLERNPRPERLDQPDDQPPEPPPKKKRKPR